MKVIIKNKSNLTKAIILTCLFIIFHFLGYFAATPYLSNFAPQPFYWEKIELKEVIFPSYISPFRKVEYRYIEKWGNEIILIEKIESIFSYDIPRDICKIGRDLLKIQAANKCMNKLIKDKSQNMQISFGDTRQYYNPETDGQFMRGFAGDDYPNWLFFIVQYLIFAATIYFTHKAIKLKKE